MPCPVCCTPPAPTVCDCCITHGGFPTAWNTSEILFTGPQGQYQFCSINNPPVGNCPASCYNGTHSLTAAFGQFITGLGGDGPQQWIKYIPNFPGCVGTVIRPAPFPIFQGMAIVLTCANTFTQVAGGPTPPAETKCMYLIFVGACQFPIYYYMGRSQFNCAGPNTFTLKGPFGCLPDMPDTITLTPGTAIFPCRGCCWNLNEVSPNTLTMFITPTGGNCPVTFPLNGAPITLTKTTDGNIKTWVAANIPYGGGFITFNFSCTVNQGAVPFYRLLYGQFPQGFSSNTGFVTPLSCFPFYWAATLGGTLGLNPINPNINCTFTADVVVVE